MITTIKYILWLGLLFGCSYRTVLSKSDFPATLDLVGDLEMQQEIWKEIPGHPFYEVSSLGRIRSWNNNGHGRRSSPKILKLTKGSNTYMGVWLGRLQSKSVHRLVIEAFIGPCPKGMECCHNDGNKTNNKAYNLRWGTHQDNCADKKSHGTFLAGDNHPMSKLNSYQVLKIKNRLKSKEKQGNIAKDCGVTDSAISDIKHGRSWAHLQQKEIK